MKMSIQHMDLQSLTSDTPIFLTRSKTISEISEDEDDTEPGAAEEDLADAEVQAVHEKEAEDPGGDNPLAAQARRQGLRVDAGSSWPPGTERVYPVVELA